MAHREVVPSTLHLCHFGGLPRTLHFLPLWWGVPSTLQFVPSGMTFNAVLAMVNVSTPWSEVAEGTPFASWWDQQFECALPMIELDSLDQQLEWVTAQSFRAGNNGRLKPFSGLTAEAQARHGGLQPSGAGVVRLVMRPVMCEVADHTPSDVNVARKDRFWGIFVQRTSQRIQWTFQRVSRDCTERSVAGSLLTVYPDAADALDALLKTINGISIPQDQQRSRQNHMRTTSGRIRWTLLPDYCMHAVVVMLCPAPSTTPMSPAAPLCGHLLDVPASILLLRSCPVHALVHKDSNLASGYTTIVRLGFTLSHPTQCFPQANQLSPRSGTS